MKTAMPIGRTRLEKSMKHIRQSDRTENRAEELMYVAKYVTETWKKNPIIRLGGRSCTIFFFWVWYAHQIGKANRKSLNENYTTVGVGKNLSDRFCIGNGLKEGDALSSLLYNFALDTPLGGFRLTSTAWN